MNAGSPGDIPRLLDLTPGDVDLPSVHGIVCGLNWTDEAALLLFLTCHSQVVAIAKAGEPESFMTSGEGWIYTEWPFEVVEPIKARPEDALRRARTMTVLQSGGAIRVNGRTVTAVPPPEWPGVVPGRTYLLFLGSRVPETGALRLIEGIELGPRRASERALSYTILHRLPPERLKAMALRQARAAAARRDCDR